MMKNSYRFPVRICCGCTTLQGLWLCHTELPILMFFSNLENAITDSVVIPCDYSKFIINAYLGCVYSHGMLFLSPYNAKKIILYDNEEHKFIAMKLKGVSKVNQQVFSGNFIHKNECIFFPCKYRFLVKYDIRKNLLSYLEVPDDVMEDDDFITKFVVINDAVIATLYRERSFLIYNITDNVWRKKKVLGDGMGFSKIIFINHKYIALNYSEGIVECFNQYTFEKECELNVEDVFGYSIEWDGINIIRMDEIHIMINVIETGDCIVCDYSLNIIRDAPEVRLDRGYAFSIEDTRRRINIFEKHRHGIVNEDLTITFDEVIDNVNTLVKAVNYCADNGIAINENNDISLNEFLIGINKSVDRLYKKSLISSGNDIYRSILR